MEVLKGSHPSSNAGGKLAPDSFAIPDFIGQTFETAQVIPLEFLAFLSFSNLSSSAFALAAACSPWENAEFEILGSQLSH